MTGLQTAALDALGCLCAVALFLLVSAWGGATLYVNLFDKRKDK